VHRNSTTPSRRFGVDPVGADVRAREDDGGPADGSPHQKRHAMPAAESSSPVTSPGRRKPETQNSRGMRQLSTNTNRANTIRMIAHKRPAAGKVIHIRFTVEPDFYFLGLEC